jgi:membrane-associated phospholipid phosphatase
MLPTRSARRVEPARPGAQPRTFRPLWAVWVGAGGLLLVIASSLVARHGSVPGWERQIFRTVNGLPGWLYRPMWLMQIAGVLGTPLLVAVGALLWRKWRLAAALVLLAPLKLFVELKVLKVLVERGRPGQNEPGAILRHVPPAGLSFPSGHAIVAFGIAVLLAPYLGVRGRTVVFGLAVLVGVARIYLGAHNPLDVAAGAGAGLLLGGLLTLLLGVRTGSRRGR